MDSLRVSGLPLDELRKHFTQDGFKVMGEIGLQYEGISPSDPSRAIRISHWPRNWIFRWRSTWAPEGQGSANLSVPKFRGSMGDPLLLEGLAGTPPKTAGTSDACGLSHDR